MGDTHVKDLFMDVILLSALKHLNKLNKKPPPLYFMLGSLSSQAAMWPWQLFHHPGGSAHCLHCTQSTVVLQSTVFYTLKKDTLAVQCSYRKCPQGVGRAEMGQPLGVEGGAQ